MKKILLLVALFAVPLTSWGATGAAPPTTHTNAVVAYLEGKGLTIESRFSVPGDLQGYAGITPQGKRIVFYTTPNGSLALFGALIDAHGHNLTATYQKVYVQQPENQTLYAQLEKTHWIRAGAVHPRRIVYAFVDPNCPYCHMFWEKAAKVYSKGVQVRYIIVGILGDSSVKKAAAILGAKNPYAAYLKNERGFSEHAGGIKPMTKIPDRLRDEIVEHNRLMQQFGLDGTPGLVWKNADGRVQTSNGLPPDVYLDKRVFGLRKGLE